MHALSRFFLLGLHRFVDPVHLGIFFVLIFSVGQWQPDVFHQNVHLVLKSFIASASIGQFAHLVILYPFLMFSTVRTAIESRNEVGGLGENNTQINPILARRTLKIFAVLASILTLGFSFWPGTRGAIGWQESIGSVFALIFYFEILFRTDERTPYRAILRDITFAGIAGAIATVVALTAGAKAPGSNLLVFSYLSGLALFGSKILYQLYKKQAPQ